MEKPERLDKLLAAQGMGSRRDVQKLVRAGAVTVDGAVVKSADLKVAPGAVVLVGGRPVTLKKHLYLMLNKPMGVVSASRGAGDVTVVDLVPPALRRQGLFPAGRLDKDTTGFVLITDDGDFAHDILSPRHHVPKTYLAQVDGDLTPAMAEAFAAGIDLHGDGPCQPAALSILAPRTAQVVLREGMYHQIKRMFSACGVHVTALHRVAMGGLPLDENLAEGACRELTPAELEQLRGGQD